jgi:uncharacterized protein YndB with AHSA1/START domain
MSTASDRELGMTRVYAAPRELVFRAWTEPDRLVQWWGPHGFRTTTHSFDLRPGGSWQYTMHGPDGRDYPNRITYREIVSPERLVYDHGDDEAVRFHVTVTFKDLGGTTELTMRSVFDSADYLARVVKEYGADKGMVQHLDRLGGFVGTTDRDIVSVGTFDAPPEAVYAAFADSARLARWWGPAGFRDTIHTFDLRPGGQWKHTMHGPDGTDYHNEATFVEVVPNQRIVFDHTKPMHRFRMTMTFAGAGGKTTLTWRMTHASAEECAKMKAFVPAANEQNFDRLALELATTTSDRSW